MKGSIGIPARGESFFPRDREVRRIISSLKNGNNLNIAAPRRVGKTSILWHLLDRKEGDFVYIYVDTEDINNEEEFFKRVLNAFLKNKEVRESGKLARLLESTLAFFGKIKGIKVMGQGIDFSEGHDPVDIKARLEEFLCDMVKDGGREFVILIDEFPQTIQNIIDANPGNDQPARRFLQANRALRLNPGISEKVRFIYTGSIGLNYTVSRIAASAFINDLNGIEVYPLNKEEAICLLEGLLAADGYTMGKDVMDHLLNKIGWLIPFHIQLAVREIKGRLLPEESIDMSVVDVAFREIIQSRNESHFNHYYSRLAKQFKEQEYTFVHELLMKLAGVERLFKAEVFDLATPFQLGDKWRNLLDVLIYDGYVNEDENGAYSFNSPIIRLWWQRHICK